MGPTARPPRPRAGSARSGSARGASPGGDVPPLRRRDAALAAGLLAALAALYLGASDLLPGNDATGSVYTAAALLAEGRLDLAPEREPWLFTFEDRRPGGRPLRLHDLAAPVDGVPASARLAAGELSPVAPYYLARAARPDPATGRPRWVSGFGPGAPLAALPVLAPLRLVAGDLRARPALLWGGARAAAALLTAAAAALLYLAARALAPPLPSALAALLLGLGTPAWGVASQALWQHPADLFFLCLGAASLTRARRSPALAALAGLALAAAAACRPQSALLAAVALGWLLLVDRRAAAAFAAGAAPPALGLAAWNWWWLGSPLAFGQVEVSRAIALAKTGVAEPWAWRVGESLPGLLLSPSRGLLAFSPVLGLAALGAREAFRRERYAPLRPLAAGALLLLVLECGWFDWWGGWSFGWRRLTALAPALVLLLLPLGPWLAAAAWRRWLTGALAAWAVAAQALGALAYDLDGWNARRAWRLAPPGGGEVTLLDPEEATAAVARGARVVAVLRLDVDLPAHRHRLWSVSDSQLAWSVRNLGEARRARRAQAAAWLAEWTR